MGVRGRGGCGVALGLSVGSKVFFFVAAGEKEMVVDAGDLGGW